MCGGIPLLRGRHATHAVHNRMRGNPDDIFSPNKTRGSLHNLASTLTDQRDSHSPPLGKPSVSGVKYSWSAIGSARPGIPSPIRIHSQRPLAPLDPTAHPHINNDTCQRQHHPWPAQHLQFHPPAWGPRLISSPSTTSATTNPNGAQTGTVISSLSSTWGGEAEQPSPSQPKLIWAKQRHPVLHLGPISAANPLAQVRVSRPGSHLPV